MSGRFVPDSFVVPTGFEDEMDTQVWRALSAWLTTDRPFDRVDYATRG